MNPGEYVATPQVPSSQYWSGYDSPKRWSSYWIQIERALTLPSGPLLEIGVGNGLVADYLRRVGLRKVTTLDIDSELDPDVVGNILHLPFPVAEFSCVMACEVLEHLPFDEVPVALREMRRVAQHAIISVPNTGWCVNVTVATRFNNRRFKLSVPWFRKFRATTVPGEHFWELGMKGYPEGKLRGVITDAGWTIEDDLRNPANPFHHFFFLRSSE